MNLYDIAYKHLISPLRTRRFAPHLRSRLEANKRLLESEDLSSIVSQRLNNLVQHATRTCPFWTRRFRESEIDPAKVESLEDLRRLPLLEKSDVRECRAELLSTAIDLPMPDMTGGSTAAPMQFYRDSECLAERVSNEWLFFSWYGRQPHDRWGHIWGSQRDLGETASFKSRLRSRLLERAIVLPGNKLSPQLIDRFLISIRKFRPSFLHAYSQAAFLVGRYVLESGQSAPPVRATTVTAEPISEMQRQVIDRAFHCRTYSIYGTREFGMIAAESPLEPGLQVNPLNALVEVLRPDGSSAHPGEPGQVVVTDLLNRAMPLIRYRIGDVASTREPGKLGLPRLDLVGGRETDFIVTPEGRFVSGASLTLITAPGIAQLQYRQDLERRLTVNYIPTADFNTAALLELERNLRDVIGPEMSYEFNAVDSIPLLPSGKLQYVHSEISRKHMAVSQECDLCASSNA